MFDKKSLIIIGVILVAYIVYKTCYKNKEKFSYVEKDTNVYQEVDSKSYQESKDKKIKEKQIKPLEHSVGFYDADGDFEKNKNKIPYTNCN